MSQSNPNFGKTNMTDGAVSIMDFQRKDAVNVLVQCILQSSYEQINLEVNKLAKGSGGIDKITSDELRKILCSLGGASFDVQKIINLLSIDNQINRSKFINLLDEARLDAKFSS